MFVVLSCPPHELLAYPYLAQIIGAELSDDEPARGLVRLRMRALGALGHRNLEQCAELLEEVWTRADARTEGAEREGWQATMVDLGWDLLVA